MAAAHTDQLVAARNAFTSGMNVVAGLAAVLLAGFAVLTITLPRHIRPSGEQSRPEELRVA